MLACAGSDVDQPVGGLHCLLIVLDDDDRVAEVTQPQQRVEQFLVVPLVQADRRLVEHVEHADEAGADLRGEPDPLCLAARQGRARPVERQVVESHVEQEAEAGVDLLEDEPRDRHVALGQLPVEQVLGQLADRQRAVAGDRLVVDRHREGDRLEPRATAGRARHLAHETRELLPARVGLGLRVTALDVGDRALEVRVVRALTAVTVLVPDVDLLVQAVQQGLLGLGGEPLPRGVHPEAHGLGQRLDQAVEVIADVTAGPRGDRPLVQGLGRVGDDEVGVDLHPGAETGAVRTGTPRGVETERPRLELVERQVVVQAGQVLRSTSARGAGHRQAGRRSPG